MRKIIVLSFISLDGVMQAPGGQEEDTSGGFKFGGWTFPYFDEFSGEMMAKQMDRPFDLLLGRKTFDIFVAYWPKHQEEYDGIGQKFSKATKYVVSTTLKESPWEKSVFINDNVVAELKKLKEGDGPELQVHGSGNLIQTLLKEDLVDELWLKIFPVTLGNGKKLYAEGTIPETWKLTESNVSPSGVIFANYTRDGEVKTGTF